MAVCIKDCIQNMNLVIGCTIGCSYCYARNNVRRFHMIDDFEKPEFFPNKLRLMEKKRPQNFLLTGMSDFAHWNPEWRNQIFSKMAENPQHQYLFLTKRPEDIVLSTTLENAWFGITVTSSKEKSHIRTWFRCTTLSTTRETEATSVVWRIKRNGWRKKTAVPSWTTSCPTAGQSLDTRSLWITFTTRKCVARKTAGDATPKNNL